MEELFEYLVPLKGLFKKQRDPKVIESYKNLEDFAEIVDDFKAAQSFLNDTVRIGQKCVYRKEKVTVFYTKDIVKACFTVHGYESTDEFATITLTFADGSEERLCKTQETDPDIAEGIFSKLSEIGIKTVIADNR